MTWPASDHTDGRTFFNPSGGAGQPFTAVPRMLSEPRARWPAHVPVTPQIPPPRGDSAAVVTFIGHATFLIQTAAGNILTDPVYSRRAGPLNLIGPRRVREPAVRFDDLPPIALVLLSHNHYDHMDLPTLRRLHLQHRPLMVAPLGNDTILRRAIPGVRVVTGDWWDRIDIGGGGIVTIVPAYHWSSRTGRDRRMALWCGFMLNTPAGSTYFAGDTGYGDGHIFREVRRRIGRPDLALIPIGAYAPRWFMSAQHTDPSEAVQILEDLEASRGLGIHWGVFQLTDERRDEPPELLLEALGRRGIAADLFPAGEPGLSY